MWRKSTNVACKYRKGNDWKTTEELDVFPSEGTVAYSEQNQ